MVVIRCAEGAAFVFKHPLLMKIYVILQLLAELPSQVFLLSMLSLSTLSCALHTLTELNIMLMCMCVGSIACDDRQRSYHQVQSRRGGWQSLPCVVFSLIYPFYLAFVSLVCLSVCSDGQSTPVSTVHKVRLSKSESQNDPVFESDYCGQFIYFSL